MEFNWQRLMNEIRATEFTPVGKAFHDNEVNDSVEKYHVNSDYKIPQETQAKMIFTGRNLIDTYKYFAEAYANGLDHWGLFLYSRLIPKESAGHKMSVPCGNQSSIEYSFIDPAKDWAMTFHGFEDNQLAIFTRDYMEEYLLDAHHFLERYVCDYNRLGRYLAEDTKKRGGSGVWDSQFSEYRDPICLAAFGGYKGWGDFHTLNSSHNEHLDMSLGRALKFMVPYVEQNIAKPLLDAYAKADGGRIPESDGIKRSAISKEFASHILEKEKYCLGLKNR